MAKIELMEILSLIFESEKGVRLRGTNKRTLMTSQPMENLSLGHICN